MRSIIAMLLLFMLEGFMSTSTGHAEAKDISASDAKTTEIAVFASGCFWGTEYMFQHEKGVLSTRVGFCGGHVDHPSYKQVCYTDTGHAESIEITFEPKQVTYEQLARRFFETHDPTQVNRQGPDVGEQYRSVIFYQNDEQKKVAEKLVAELKAKGVDVATQIVPAAKFWPAEDYHQKYYEKTGGHPYCHVFKKLF